MIVLVEIGNSAIKVAQLADGLLQGIKKIHYQTMEIAEVLEALSISGAEKILLASVANAALTAALVQHWEGQEKIPVQQVQTQQNFDEIKNGYEEYQQLGVDRWLNLIAAYRTRADAYMIVDAGTAVTLDWIAATGEHLGGFILPGLRLRINSLSQNTGIGRFSNSEITNLSLARDTKNAVQRGALYSIVADIDRFYEDTIRKYNTQFNGIITGGDAGIINQYLKNSFELSPSLTLFGLAAFADETL